jgi:ATP-dependent helicase/nuclease subunit A
VAGNQTRTRQHACTPVDGDRLLEGYVDVLYRSDEGLVVVDYKTSSTSNAGVLDQRVEGYRFQGASYVLAVSAATGEPVERVTFVFSPVTGRWNGTWPTSTRRLQKSGSWS